MAKTMAERKGSAALGVDAELAKRLLHDMLRIRRFEEKAAEAYTLGKIGGFLHLYIGQEAVAVGATSVLRGDDYAISAYREHGHCLAKGSDPKRMMAELFGRRDGRRARPSSASGRTPSPGSGRARGRPRSRSRPRGGPRWRRPRPPPGRCRGGGSRRSCRACTPPPPSPRSGGSGACRAGAASPARRPRRGPRTPSARPSSSPCVPPATSASG